MKIATAASAAALAWLLAIPAASAQDLQSGNRTVSGQLEQSDPALEQEQATEARAHYDDHRIRLRAGERVAISLDSDEFDPMLHVFRAGALDQAIAENDDFGDGLNSRVSFAAPADGDYVVRVLSFEPGTFGAYTLRAEPLAPWPEPARLGSPAATSTTTWRSYQGTLAEGDASSDEGAFFDDYRVTLRAGEQLLVRVDADGFDPMIHVLAAGDRAGVPIDGDDDAGPGLNSMLGFEAEEAGDYLVRVTSFMPGATGAYTLRVGN